jgi:P27 family predicted phage terminase small subunit
LKLIAGNRGHRPLRKDEPIPEANIPAVPPHLSDEAKVEWGRIVNKLYNLGLMTDVDRAALAAYCQCYADWIEAEEQIRRFGKVVKSPVREVVRRRRDGTEETERTGGYPMQSPFLAIRNKALELMHRYLIEFGLSPSSRSRVSATGQPAAEDPARKYLK